MITYIEITKEFTTVEGIPLDKLILIPSSYVIDTVQFNRSAVIFRAFVSIEAFLKGNTPLRGVTQLPPAENTDAIVVATDFTIEEFFRLPVTELCLEGAMRTLEIELAADVTIKTEHDPRVKIANTTPIAGEGDTEQGEDRINP